MAKVAIEIRGLRVARTRLNLISDVPAVRRVEGGLEVETLEIEEKAIFGVSGRVVNDRGIRVLEANVEVRRNGKFLDREINLWVYNQGGEPMVRLANDKGWNRSFEVGRGENVRRILDSEIFQGVALREPGSMVAARYDNNVVQHVTRVTRMARR